MAVDQAEMKRFVGLFVEPIPISSANCNEFGFVKHPMTATWVKAALEAGYLEWFIGDECPLVDSNAIFVRRMEITDAGRELCGLPVINLKTKEHKSAQGSLFD